MLIQSWMGDENMNAVLIVWSKPDNTIFSELTTNITIKVITFTSVTHDTNVHWQTQTADGGFEQRFFSTCFQTVKTK